jgi:hypothetical protein
MLYGEFRETRSNNLEKVEVKLEYSGRVLQLLVEFCFTDKLLSLNNYNVTGSDTSTFTLEAKARLLTNLSGAAHYFDIPKLENDLKHQLNGMMLDHPSLACAILDESSTMLSGEELGKIAVERIRARPKAALLNWNNCVVSSTYSSINTDINNSVTVDNGGVMSLNASLLEQVIFDDQSTASELTKFLCLKQWVHGCKHSVLADDGFIGDIDLPRKQPDPNGVQCSRTLQTPRMHIGTVINGGRSSSVHPRSLSSKTQNDEPSSSDDQHEQRLMIATHLSQKLDLSLIPASDLSTTITESKLIPTHDLFQAYRLQALNAERTKSKVFVEGAGLAEVNGTYIQRGVHEGTPMYNKEGFWRDHEEVYRIFLCTYSNGNKSWCLSIVPKGKEPGKTTDLDFYECPVSYGKSGGIASGAYGGLMENGYGVVPSRGWKLVNYGQPPVPKCSLIAGCLEDE